MRFHDYYKVIFFSLALFMSGAHAFSSSSGMATHCRFSFQTNSRLFAEDDSSQERTSFEEAKQGLTDEEDNKRMEEMGDFDENPAYKSDNIEAMRAAIRKRTSEMGLEKSVVTQEILKASAAQAAQASSQGNENQLDVTKIRGQLSDDMPSMFYNPDEEMTDQEKAEVDPISQENLWVQGQNELTSSKWPGVGATLREVLVMIVVVALTAGLIIQWDVFLRVFYTDTLHMIPTADEISSRFQGLDLPEGWTDSLNEQDVASLPDAVREVTTSSKLPEL